MSQLSQQARQVRTGIPSYDLLAAIIERAAIDAAGEGKTAAEAKEWLEDMLSGRRHWRQRVADRRRSETQGRNCRR